MKTCTKCRKSLSEDQFHWRSREKGLRISRCKTCSARWAKEHYKKNKEMFVQKAHKWNQKAKEEVFKFVYQYLLTHPCVECGEADPVVLDFDHVTDNKAYNISRIMHGSWGLKDVKEEMAKCEVRCANCHRRRTAEQFGWRKLKASGEA